jgi:hypothetical protein
LSKPIKFCSNATLGVHFQVTPYNFVRLVLRHWV